MSNLTEYYRRPGEVRCVQCKEWVSNNELENADGFCPHCDAEIRTDESPYSDKREAAK